MSKKGDGCGYTVGGGALVLLVIRLGVRYLSNIQRSHAYYDASGNYVMPGFGEIILSYLSSFLASLPPFSDILPFLLICLGIPLIIIIITAIVMERPHRRGMEMAEQEIEQVRKERAKEWLNKWLEEESKRRQEAEKQGLLHEYEQARAGGLVHSIEKRLARYKEHLQEYKEQEKLGPLSELDREYMQRYEEWVLRDEQRLAEAQQRLQEKESQTDKDT